jgi:predicted transcriptional regulator
MDCKRCGGTGVEPDQKAIAAKMRLHRQRAGVTAKAVARRMKLTPAFICDLEHARRDWRLPTMEHYMDAINYLRPLNNQPPQGARK